MCSLCKPTLAPPTLFPDRHLSSVLQNTDIMDSLHDDIKRHLNSLPVGICIPPTDEGQEKLEWLSRAPGPRGEHRYAEDAAAVRGNSLSIKNSKLLGVSVETLNRWFQGVHLTRIAPITPTTARDYPLFRNHGTLACTETDRLAALNKSYWYSSPPEDLNVCPSNLIVKTDKTRIVRDFSHHKAGINSALANRSVDYATLDLFAAPLQPRDFMAGIDFQDCFLHWLVAPEDRRLLGLRHPTSGQLGTYLFLPFGLGPSPGENDRSVKEVLKIIRYWCPTVHIVDFVDDLRLAIPGADRAVLSDAVTRALAILAAIGVRFHTKESKLFWPTRCIPFLGFLIDTEAFVIRITPEKLAKALASLRPFVSHALHGARHPHNLMLMDLVKLVGFLNFLAPIIPGGEACLRSSWRVINSMDPHSAWAQGKKFNPKISMTEEATIDLRWWHRAISSVPVRPLIRLAGTTFFWHSRLKNSEALAEATPPHIRVVVHSDASATGLGYTIDEKAFSRHWQPSEVNRSSNWKELRAVLEPWISQPELLRGKLVIAKTDNATAAGYANIGAGSSPQLAELARELKLIEVELGSFILCSHISGRYNSTADALSRLIPTSDLPEIGPSALIGKRAWSRIRNFSTSERILTPPHSQVDEVIENLLRNSAPGTLALLPMRPAHPWIRSLKGLSKLHTFPRGQRLFSRGYANSAGTTCATKEPFGLFSSPSW